MTERPTHESLWLIVARRLAPRNNEGIIFETRFQSALEELVNEGAISEWTHTSKHSEED